MDYPKESLDRQKKIEDLKKAGVIVYANKFEGKTDISELKVKSGKFKEENGKLVEVEGEGNTEVLKDAKELMSGNIVGEFKTAGRIMSSRSMGKLTFAKLRDNTADIQVCFSKNSVKFNTGRPHPDPLLRGEGKTEIVSELEIGGEVKSAYKIAEKFAQVGDYIGVIGDLFVTKHGELTLFVKEFQFMAKAIRPLPEKYHGIQDKEAIYRQRYLDLIMNEDSYERFLFRSKFIKTLRDFYHENGFIEITTPTLGNAASGAAAKPFITHHNDFDIDVYLRIAPEIGLKMATVGRFEKVFEFATNFRNEGSDPSHVQEFNVVEHYAAWWNFEDNIRFTEKMFDYLFDKLNIPRKIAVKDKEGNEKIVDFTTPFERIDYVEGVKKACGIDVSKYQIGDEEKLIADIKAAGVEFEGMDKMATPTLIDYLYKKVLRPSIVGPAFVYNYPKTMQPLARQNDQNPNIVEQFQLVINGWEVNKAYSELVDPAIQKANFEAQAGALEKGDEEATQGDDEFVLAMEYGMPPQSGFGMGFERILAILTGQDNLRDVQLFPLMKPLNSEKKEENSKKMQSNSQGEEIKKVNENIKLPSREEVLKLVDKYATNTKQHLLQVGDIMEYFAEKLGENKDYWWTVGVLHDIDWDYIGKDGNKHCKDDLEKICKEANIPEEIVKDIKSHAYGLVEGIEEKPDTLVRKYLASVDELSGFMWAYFRMNPSNNPMDIKAKSIKKKIKDKSFAAGVDREQVKNSETLLGIPLDEFIEDIKVALSKNKWEK